MKKIYKLAFALLMGAQFSSQAQFFTPTTYRGAFAPAPTAMWTDNWTDWDPQNTPHSAPTATVSANITSNTTWTSNNVYLIQGLVHVTNGATLTIQPGTTILGDKTIPNSSLIITTGSKIDAQGTANNPIVFTSNQAPGSRGLGDWGGIILLGKAQLNTVNDTASVEGVAHSPLIVYGGGATPDDADNSGIMQYVRIEFGGYIFAPNKEINGLTFGGVGSGTTIDHIQVSFSNDDAYEWFGGSVKCKYLVSYRNLDDDFDTDFGYHGQVQFILSVRDPNIADNPSVSTSEGFESDNDAAGSTNTPLTSTIFSNATLIGPYRGNTASTVATGYRRGARIRRNSNLKIANSIFMDHVRGVHIDGALCEANAASGALGFTHNIVAGNTTARVCEVNSGSTFNIWSWFGATNFYGANDSLVSSANILVTPYNYTSPDYRPVSGSIAESGADFTPSFFAGLVGVKENQNLVNSFNVFPNPATNNVSVNMNIEKAENVTVTVSDITGRVVATVYENASLASGNHTAELNTTSFTSGMYFVTVSTENSKQTVKLIINK